MKKHFVVIGFLFLTFIYSCIFQVEENAGRKVIVEEIDSPFSKRGKAVIVETPSDQQHTLTWSADSIIPGKIYSLSFFFQQANNIPSENPPRILIRVFDGGTRVFYQSLHPGPEACFYVDNLVFNSSSVRVSFTFQPNQKVILGDFGTSIWASDLKVTRFPKRSILWPYSIRLPAIYRGLRNFSIKTSFGSNATNHTQAARIERIVVTAKMNVSTAKLPRLLPGDNLLNVAYSSAEPDANVNVSISTRNKPNVSKVYLNADRIIPADGATFGRVFLSAVDNRKKLISGPFFRLRCPPQIKSFPYTRVITDWDKEQFIKEFHLLSTSTGTYSIPIELWDGTKWSLIENELKIIFNDNKKEKYTNFKRVDYPRRWLEPGIIKSKVTSGSDTIDIRLHGHDRHERIPINIQSKLMPEFCWTITGPVSNLGLFNAFQPDPRTLETIGESFKDMVYEGEKKLSEEDMALAIEEYVNLFMEGYRPENFDNRMYLSGGRIHREGRGWCANYAKAVFVLALQSGLEATMDNTRGHVMGKVRGRSLNPIVLDALLQVGVCSATGDRVDLKSIETPEKRILGVGVNNKSRRGTGLQYYEKITNYSNNWQSIKPNTYIYALVDNEVFTINLEPWEKMEWIGGYVNNCYAVFTRGELGIHQTVITKTAKIVLTKNADNPKIIIENLVADEDGFAKSGRVSFSFEVPVEVDDLFVSAEGTLGDAGFSTIDIVPVLYTPLINGVSSLINK